MYARRAVVTGDYQGPDRRKEKDLTKPEHRLGFDAKGDPVWEVRADGIQRRRSNDDTVNLLKCLVPDSLSLEEDAPEKRQESGFNPYNNSRDD